MNKDPVHPLSGRSVLELLPPYPSVLVTTRDNVLTVNQVAYFTFTPLRIGIGIARIRHSHGLISAEREFVVNVPDASLVEAVKVCGSASGRDGDKFVAAGLDREPSDRVAAVSLAQCRARIECRVTQEIPFEERTWFIGEVLAARRSPDHLGSASLTCDREFYRLPGEAVASR
jgi:flavin reductase (DIM6/NTAB) family NADH-FMN oxidoreductase RutF